MTVLTACGGAARARGPAPPTRLHGLPVIAAADWARLAGTPGGKGEGVEIEGPVGVQRGEGALQAALVVHHSPAQSEWILVVARDPRTPNGTRRVALLPRRAQRPSVTKARLDTLRAGEEELIRVDVSFYEERAPHGFATRTVIAGLGPEGQPVVLLDRLSEVGSDEAQKRALVSAADLDGDGRWELIFDERMGVEKRRVVYRRQPAGFRTGDASLFATR